MIYGDQWTGARVTARLVQAFRRLPATPIYAPTRDRLESALFDRPVDGVELILATNRYLGQASDDRLCLLTFARAKADGTAIVRLCRDRGWSRATFYRRVTRAAETVAARLNRDRAQASTPLPVRHFPAPC